MIFMACDRRLKSLLKCVFSNVCAAFLPRKELSYKQHSAVQDQVLGGECAAAAKD